MNRCRTDIPEYPTAEVVTVRVIAGSSNGVGGAMTREDAEPLYIASTCRQGSLFSTALPALHNAFVFVYRGAVTIGGTTLNESRMGILVNTPQADGVTISAAVPPKPFLFPACRWTNLSRSTGGS